jgi:hypothetical protein
MACKHMYMRPGDLTLMGLPYSESSFHNNSPAASAERGKGCHHLSMGVREGACQSQWQEEASMASFHLSMARGCSVLITRRGYI